MNRGEERENAKCEMGGWDKLQFIGQGPFSKAPSGRELSRSD